MTGSHWSSSDGTNRTEAALPYRGTEGFVSGSDTSRDRAVKDALSGGASARQRLVLEALETVPSGMTWRELGDALNLHHGKISGTLSVLHKQGKIVALKTKRDNCHPYLAMRWAVELPASVVIWEPAKTHSRVKRQATDVVVEAARAVSQNCDLISLNELNRALAALDAIGDA